MPENASGENAAWCLAVPPVLPHEEDNERPNANAEACLKAVPIFAKLSEIEIAAFQNAARPRSFKKGKMLFVEGEAAGYFYVIVSGWVKQFHTMPDGDEVIIDMLTKSDLVGESAIFEKDRHTSSAQVIEDVQLLSLPLNILKEQILANRTLALSMLLAMSRHHRRHCSERALNSMQSAPQRVGYFLLKMCPKNQVEAVIFHLPYNKTLIAETLGMKSETFSRALNILRTKLGLRIKGSSVEIDSIERLVEFVYGPAATRVTAANTNI
jgi:CRP-like cAMP-binding protein